MKKYILLLILCFPLYVNASVLQYNGAFYPGQCGEPGNGFGPSHLCQKYSVDGEDATCIDAAVCNPDVGRDILEERTLTVNDSFGKGLIAIANYATTKGLSETELAHTYRIYTARVSAVPGLVVNISRVANMDYGDDGSNEKIKKAVEIGECASGSGSGSCSSEEVDKYLPGGDAEELSKLEVIKTGQDDKSTKNNVKVVGYVEITPHEIKPKSCSASGYDCKVVETDEGVNVIVTGKKSNKSGVKVILKFEGISVNSSMVSEIKLYQCNQGTNCSLNTTCNTGGTTQRFIKLKTSKSKNVEKSIYLNFKSICDEFDPYSLTEDSKEEEEYIKECGPIVQIENDCGADSCSNDGYKDFTHSYVRQLPMKSIMKELENNSFDTVEEYRDSEYEPTRNEYCKIYTTEKIDVLMPATAASISGQFFIFDVYNDLNCNDDNICLRQPYVVGRGKSLFFINYKKWINDYNLKIFEEENNFNLWQKAVKAVKGAYNEKKKCENKSCKLCIEYDQDNHCIKYDDGTPEKIRTENDYYIALNNEKTTRSNYQSTLQERVKLQNLKTECQEAMDKYSDNFKYDFDPNLSFIYNQNSELKGNKSYVMPMEINNENGVKYWPHVTSKSTDNVDYLDLYCKGLKIDKNNFNVFETEEECKYDLEKNIVNPRNNSKPVYLVNDEGETREYTFPSSDISKDACSNISSCKKYIWDNRAFLTIQANNQLTDDVFDKVTLNDPDEVFSNFIYYRPTENTFALMNTGEYVKTLNYNSNDAITQINGLEVGYVYNLELTAYKGSYTTNFEFGNVGYKSSNRKKAYSQELFDEKVEKLGYDKLSSTCNYCNYEMAFKRECPECNPEDQGDFTAQFYYRSISLSDVNPNEKLEGETNWSDAKGLAAVNAIEAVSGNQIIGNVSDAGYLAVASGSNLNKQNSPDIDYTYLAESSGYDIYDDESREFLEYEITLTPKDMQIIKKNSAKSNFDYAKMNMCGNSIPTNKDADNDYCFKCNNDMKECESSFVTAFFDEDTTNETRRNKWKYYNGENNIFCKGSINSCLGGRYPDPVFAKSYIAENKNWP